MESRYLTDLEWRICHAVNIYVFRNGKDGERPTLVHIPPAKKKNMKSVLNAIQERVKYPVGYATHLYGMDGKRIRHPCDLEIYNNYVVASNYDKFFKCAQYGRRKSPLLVLNRDSKHVRVLRLQNQNYHEWMIKKKAVGEERPQFIYPTFYTSENARAQDLPVKQLGNFVPPGAKSGGACCKSTVPGGKTFRVDQVQTQVEDSKRPQQEFVVNSCVITNTRKGNNRTMKKISGPLVKKQAEKIEDPRLPRKGQLSTKNGMKCVKITKSDILNANAVVGTEDENRQNTSESDVLSSELDKATSNTTDIDQETTSEEALDRKYKDLVKQLKKVKSRKRQEKANLGVTLQSNCNVNSTSKIGTNPYRPVNGKQMLVLPPPPLKFRDDRGMLPDIKDSSNASVQNAPNTFWNDTTKAISNSPFVLSDGQLRPQPRHSFCQQTGSCHNPGQSGQSIQQFPMGFQSNRFVHPVFRANVIHNDGFQHPQIPGASNSSQTHKGPSQTFSCPENSIYNIVQQPVCGNSGMKSHYLMMGQLIPAVREERSDAEVDIPYTPMIRGRQTFRVHPTGMDSGRKIVVDPVKSRNVAIQMGYPGQNMAETLNQNSSLQRPQMIPVKVAYYTANGTSHLDDAFILQNDTKDLPSTQKHSKLGSIGQVQVLTSRVFPKTSNAATQINRMGSLYGPFQSESNSLHSGRRGEYETQTRAEPLLHSNQSFVDYFVSEAQEINSEPQIEIGELATIPPPSEFKEIFGNSARVLNFQNIPPPHPHMDQFPKSDCYF